MSADLGRYYELLGVKPGVSVSDLKAAHRDMAKVWHPDRFGHDPRLQQKAQEKLKEINEAFDILISGKVPSSPREPRPEPRRETESSYSTYVRTESVMRRADQRQSIRWHWAALPILLFVVVFGYTLRSLLHKNIDTVQVPTTESVTSSEPQRQVAGSKTDAAASRDKRETESREQVDGQSPASPTELRPMATTTVTIDPSSGLLARGDCPSKTRMTYPSGNEPNGYCTLTHPQQKPTEVAQEATKTSRVKSLTKKIVTRLNRESKSDDWSRQD